MASTLDNPAEVTSSERTLQAKDIQVAREFLARGESYDSLAQALGMDSGDEAIGAIANTIGFGTADLSKVTVDTESVKDFPVKLIHRYRIFPIGRKDGALVMATSDPFDLHALDAVSEAMSTTVFPVLVPDEDLAKLIKSYLGVGAETVDGLLLQAAAANDGVEILEDIEFDGSEDSAQAQEASVVRLVNEILSEAVMARASDIHIEAQESGLKIRYRIDGVLQKQPTPPEMNRFHAAIVSRLKIMARLNIAEKRVPQDGRIKLRVAGREIDIRVSIIPMLHGEGIVMRVLDKENLHFSLKGIGMPDSVYQRFQNLIRLPHGIVLVTGPTGSGKTTTLYSALSEIKSEDTKIITTEDPIEYQLEGINQIQVNTKVGLTFAASLRSILRHDPDVVLVGEIRDLETAENATQASLTGHLVFSTLHTNDSASAFMRLSDMGVEPFLVSSTVEGVMAQRLVRTLCKECRQTYQPAADELPEDFPLDRLGDTELFRPNGCRQCRGTGYSGRMGIYELLVSNDEVRQLANERAPSNLIKKAAQEAGMLTLRDDGWQKVLNGVTTVDEVLRVTKAD
ncbi:MAG: Flp pilus assembly complex ATPase component TadA [Planctomycetales bacterium]|nr:Flp pilus assembly complex ATPase component TadA [Planctomycetales bacterium]